MTLPDYVHGRVVFAGDAAHMLPIFGVRGANTGFQDAQNLAWKLALTLQGLAGPGLLASYSEERVAAAREIITEAGRSTRFMTPPSHGFRLLRDAVLSLSLSQPFVGPLFHWRTSRAHDHTHSALNSPDDDNALFTGGPADGAPLPNVKLGPDDFLLDHLGPGFTLLHLAPQGRLAQPLLDAVADWRARGLPLATVALRRDGAEASGADLTLADASGCVAARLGAAGAGACYLLRPDQHVCARWLGLDAQRLHRALRRALAL
jgi:3-(3-hydroxy-phenyl)propionate hydroxylase